MMMPAPICTSKSAATTRKYLPIRLWLGVGGRNVASTGSQDALAIVLRTWDVIAIFRILRRPAISASQRQRRPAPFDRRLGDKPVLDDAEIDDLI